MFLKKYGDLIVGIFFSVFSVVYFIASDRLPASKLFKVGASFMPKIYAVSLLVISVLFAIIGYRKYKSFVPNETAEEYPPEYGRMACVFLGFAIYIFLFEPLGFIVSTLLFLIAEMLIFAPSGKRDKKNFLLYCIISLIASIALFYLFYYGFNILLPKGILKGIL